MPIIPNEDENLIVDQTAVNGNGNGNHAEPEPEPEPVDDGRLEDWGEEPQQGASEPLIVDQTAVNGNGNGHHPPEEEPEEVVSEPELDEDWGDIRRPPEVPARWQDIGAYVAEHHLQDNVVVRHDDDSGEDLTWQLRTGLLWELAPKDRAPIAERLLVLQHQIVQELSAAGSAQAAKKAAQEGFADQVRGKVTPFWAGANIVLRSRPLEDPPAHLVNTPAGVRDLRARRTHPLKELPFLFTSCTSGAPGEFLAGGMDDARMLVEDHLRPSLPDPRDRDHLLKGWGQALGGQGGGKRRGSVLGCIGEPGSGKGFTLRFCEDGCGGYCRPADADSLMNKALLNDEKSRLLERNPRIITLSEVTRVFMAFLLRLTGRDTMSARSPFKLTIHRRLFCAVNIASAVAPQGRADTGLDRRLFCIHFPQAAEVSFSEATDVTPQILRDALVATLIGIAEEMYAQGDDWEGLPDEDPFTLECLRRSDPVMELARGLNAADNGRTLSELSKELADIGCRPPHGQLSDALRSTGTWEVRRGRHPAGGGNTLTRLFWVGPDDGSEGG